MKIGNHIGKRAKINDNLGYFFETIIDDVSNLFVFDEKSDTMRTPISISILTKKNSGPLVTIILLNTSLSGSKISLTWMLNFLIKK